MSNLRHIKTKYSHLGYTLGRQEKEKRQEVKKVLVPKRFQINIFFPTSHLGNLVNFKVDDMNKSIAIIF